MQAQGLPSPKSKAEQLDRGAWGGQPRDVGLCQPRTTSGSSSRRQGANAACSPPPKNNSETPHLEVLPLFSGQASRQLPSKGRMWPPAKHALCVGLLPLFF